MVATGEAHSVRELVEKAFEVVGLDWKKFVKVEKKFLRPLDVPALIGDYSKAEKELGWRPIIFFEDLVKILVKEEINRWKKWCNGERFAWDAPNYPNENGILTRSLRV